MTLRALVIDDDPAIVEEVVEALASLGHAGERAHCVEEARKHLAAGGFDYVLLDLELPVGATGRFPRVENGKNLLREIRRTPATVRTPVIVMTGHGNDGPYQAIDVLRLGAVHYVTKPFGLQGASLDDAIREVLTLDEKGNSKIDLEEGPALPFVRGDMVFTADRVELCGVKICSNEKCGLIRQVLDELRHTNTRGRFVAYSGKELAKRIGCDGGENSVSGAIRDFRKKASAALFDEANIQCGPRDIIASGGRGYRLTEKISVRSADDPVNDPDESEDDPVNRHVGDADDPVKDPEDDQLNHRQEWIMNQLKDGHPLQKGEVRTRFGCSDSTAKRDLNQLKTSGLIEFSGVAKTGHYRLRQPVQADSRRI